MGLTSEEATTDVLLLGASMAGVELWYQLRSRAAGRRLTMTVIDRQEEHGYVPLVQERLCERLQEPSVVETRRWMEADGAVRWITGEVASMQGRCVTLASGERVSGRYVVVALGSLVSAPPSFPGGELLGGLKLACEVEPTRRALDAAIRRERPHLVVIGGGISGVELAGDLAHLAESRPPGWHAPRVTLVHGAARLLPGLGERASAIARRSLERQGVELRLSTRVERVTPGSVVTSDGELRCDASFWAGGVRAPAVLGRLGLPTTDDGWLRVTPTLQCAPDSEPTIFGCGDDCRVLDASGRRWPTMQRAIECLWQAKLVARSILAMERGRRPFEHTLHEDFFHGVSMGRYSMVAYGPFALEMGGFAIWFRRFLMRQYLARYRRQPLLPAAPVRRALPGSP